MGENILEVKDVKVHFPHKEGFFEKKKYIKAVDGVSFNLKDGETVGLVGESGCGKSTTLRACGKLIDISSGSVLFRGIDISKLSYEEMIGIRKDLQFVFQDPFASLNPRFNIFSLIAEPLNIFKQRGILKINNNEISEKVGEMMEKCGLRSSFKNRYPHEFSGGQRQRIAIARALVLRPSLILLDEPVSALDVSIQSEILNLFVKLREEFKLSYVFVSHNLSVVKYISSRLVVMYLGKVVEEGSSSAIYLNPAHPYTQTLISAIPIPNPRIERSRHKVKIEGEASASVNGKGCLFYDRCPVRMDICKEKEPEFKKVEEGHFSACHRN